MKKLLLIPFFLFVPVFGGPQDTGLHLFGPQNKGPSPSDKIERFNLMGEMIGEFNCNTGEFIVTGGYNVGDKIPIGKWISKKISPSKFALFTGILMILISVFLAYDSIKNYL